MRNKAEFLKHFIWIIGRAKHYAKHTGLPIETVLFTWEEQRGYQWWFSYYQDRDQFKKLHKHPRKLRTTTFRGLIRRARLGYWSHDSKSRKSSMARVKRAIACYCADEQQEKGRRVKRKSRWNKAKKERYARYRARQSL